MPWGVVAGAAIGAIANADSSRRSANTQRDASQAANDMQWRMFQQNRADAEPWRAAGREALGQMGAGNFRDFQASDFQADPGYQFRLGQGMDQMQNSAAARGGLLSGNTLRALNEYNQNFASNEFSNAYNRFNTNQSNRFNRAASLAGLGQQVNSQVGAMGQQTAQNMGNNYMSGAAAQAAGQVGQANAWSNAFGQIGNAYMQNQMMNRWGSPAPGYQPGSAGNASLGGGGGYVPMGGE